MKKHIDTSKLWWGIPLWLVLGTLLVIVSDYING